VKQDEEIKRLLKLYLEGTANARQKNILFRYLADSKNKHSEFHDQMREAWQNEPAQRDESSKAAEGLAQIWARIEQGDQKKVKRLTIFKYAASVALFVSAAFGLYSYLKQGPVVIKPVELLSKTTAMGEKLKLILPDSSVVYLGGGSKLTWPAHFLKGGLRRIQLEGEAFFEVKRDTTSPFIVSTGKMQTRVLGTSFNIYAYPKDLSFSVAVCTGRVKVSGNTKGLSILTPGMKLIYNSAKGEFIIDSVGVNEVNYWTANRFVFRNESLKGMLMRLERYYNVHFELKTTKLAACRFNATFTDKNIKEVMEQLKIMSGNHMRYKINTTNKTIALWGEGCQ
jgi:transmembrane sensor